MRIPGRILRVLAAGLAVLVVLIVALVLATQTLWFKSWLRQFAVRQANQFLNGELSIERLDGNFFTGVSLDRVVVSMDGVPVISIDSVVVRYDVFEMISKGVSIARLAVKRPVVTLVRADEAWNLGRLVKPRPQPDNPDSKSRPIVLRQIEIIDGAVAISGQVPSGAFRLPRHFDHIDAVLALDRQADRWAIDLDRVAFQASEPAIGLRELSGSVAIDDRHVALRSVVLRTTASSLSVDGTIERHVPQPEMDLAVVSDTLSLPELAPLLPRLTGMTLRPSFEFRVRGPTSHLSIDMNVRSAAGHVSGLLLVDVAQPRQSATGRIHLEHFDLITIVRKPEAKTDVTGTATFEVRGEPLTNTDSLRWAVTLDGPHAAALGYEADDVLVRAEIAGPRISFNGQARGYGAEASGAGFVVLKGDTRPLSYDISGVARHIDLRQLPPHLHVPPAASDLNVTYQVRGSSAPGALERREVVTSGRFEDSMLEGMRMSAGSTAGLTFNEGQFQYEADATVADLDLERIGAAFDLGPLQRDRFASAISGHVTSRGRWTTIHDLSLEAEGMLTSSTMPGAHVDDLRFTANLADDSLHWQAQGHMNHVDLKTVIAPESVDGLLNGSIDVQSTMATISQGVGFDRLDLSGRVELQDSAVANVVLDRATIDGDYHPTGGVIRMLEIAGPAVTARTDGTVALDEVGESSLRFHIETPDLEQLGTLVRRPLGGTAIVDGVVTGNRRELVITGHASTNEVKYATATALELDADFTARVPALSAPDASVLSTAKATFVTVAGQNLNQLNAKISYDRRQLEFDATARQPNRSLGAAGTVTIVPEQREVRVQRLTASTQGQSWELAPGARPVVRYEDDVVMVKDLRLMNGQQLASADGTFGRPGETLTVSLDNIDVATVEVMLLRPAQLSGRLQAAATISGTRDAPRVQANVKVRGGGFRQFRYEDLSATMTYGGKGITVDAKLQQNASAWLTAKGYVPMALFQGPGNAPAHDGASPEDSVNVKIESSAIDLGLIQGFTTAVTNVTGTMQANLEITGAAADPHPGGSIDIRDAAFTVAAAGVKYTGGSGRVEFQGDRVHIDEIRLLDNQKKTMQVSGDLAFHERDLSGVDIVVKAKDFKVIDNKIGNLRINTDLHVVGELQYPRIEGDLGVSTGAIDLDELLESITDRPYSQTSASADNGATGAGGLADSQARPSFFDALQAQVHLTIPNALLVKGSDLRLSDSPVGLGAVNVTLGGDLWMSKTPWDRVRVTGVVNTVRGTYDFQGRRFDILRDGTARFDGIDEKEPRIAIVAERIIQGVQTEVHLGGTLRHPDMTFTSTPPLDQADILALIVFNQPVNQIAAGQQISLMQRARSMALGAVAVQLSNSIGSALDVDTFEIQIAPDSGAAAQVTVGQQVGQNLFLKVEQGVGEQSSTNVVVEYQINKWLMLQTNVRPNSTTLQPFQRVQGTGTDLIFVLSY